MDTFSGVDTCSVRRNIWTTARNLVGSAKILFNGSGFDKLVQENVQVKKRTG